MIVEIAAALIALVSALILTRWMCRVAPARGLLDIPNARSSHRKPTPRGGGAAIVIASYVGFAILCAAGLLDRDLLIALGGGGLLVAGVGFRDDHRPVSARWRLVVHFVAAIWALAWLGGLPPLRIGNETHELGTAGFVLGVLGIVWTLNLFNFMDGIDGIAACEAVFVATGGAVLAAAKVSGVSWGADLVFAAACGGFLVYNWPPARIFMGDVGSGFVGFVIAVLALITMRHDPPALWAWLSLGGAFFADATVTLIRRLVRGERIEDAHRDHAYQKLARRWNSHRAVTIATVLVNMFWCLPCALLATLYPGKAFWIVAGELVSLAAVAVYAGAGRPD